MSARSKVEYLVIDFDALPSGEQLGIEFGEEGWGMVSLIPISVVVEEDDEPLNKMRAYFTRSTDSIVQADKSE